MTGPHPAVAATRVAVRHALAHLSQGEPDDPEPRDREPRDREPCDREPRDSEPRDREPRDREPRDREPCDREPRDSEPRDSELRAGEQGNSAQRDHRALVLVACSGGPDSLALAAAVAFEAPRLGLRSGAVIVDHDLQEGSQEVAQRAAEHCRRLGLDPVEVVTVQVDEPGADPGSGPEARARDARYGAFEKVADRVGAVAVLLGHTRDDQAEQVLLGLSRGSGARSLAGMPARRGPYLRPLLCVPRTVTAAACDAAGLTAWVDPHNCDPAFGRVRARALLPVLEAQLGPGAVAALARSADLLRDDADALDDLAVAARESLPAGPIEAALLETLPRAIRTRVWRRLAIEAGCSPGALAASHIESLDTLVTRWRGQGPIDLPGRVQGSRTGGRVLVAATHRVG